MNAKLVFANICCLSFLSVIVLLAQGNLNPPPGVPSPTMKTLEQIEPRTDILTLAGDANSEHVLSNPGSYYLSGNLSVFKTDGLRVTAADVHIDLNGFQIVRGFGTGGGKAISLEVGAGGFSARDGSIRGFAEGIGVKTSTPVNLRVRDLSVAECAKGINLPNSSSAIVTGCSVYGASESGIRAAIITECTATECGGLALGGLIVSNSRGVSTGSASGIDAFKVENSQGVSNSGDGLSARITRGGLGSSTSGRGINSAIATGSSGVSNSNEAIVADLVDASKGVTESGGSAIVATQVHGSVGDRQAEIDFFDSRAQTGITAELVAFSSGQSAGREGIDSTLSVGSYGRGYGASHASYGIRSEVVGMSYGYSGNDNGIFCNHGVVMSSLGKTQGDGKAGIINSSEGVTAFSEGAHYFGVSHDLIITGNAVGCGVSFPATINANQKHLGTP